MATKTQQQSTQTKGVAYTTEAEFMVRSEILGGQIRTEKIRELKAELKGQTFKADRKEVWADRQQVKLATEEVKLGIDQDNLKATEVYRQLNQASHVARLSSKAYGVDATAALNKGKQQFLLNAGVDPTVVTLNVKAKAGVKV
jgi:hypothetical protein